MFLSFFHPQTTTISTVPAETAPPNSFIKWADYKIPISSVEKAFSTDNSVKINWSEVICLPIIMYHEVKSFKLGKDVISAYEFENDLKFYSENNYNTITISQLIAYVYEGKALPENPIILSFDDGYLNNYVNVLPLLKKYNSKIVLSVIGKDTDDFTKTRVSNLDYSHMTWDQLNLMINSGFVEVQNHSYNLHSSKSKRRGCLQMWGETLNHYFQVLSDDISKFQEKILKSTGVTPTTFTYPFGYFTKASESIIKKLGFKATFTCKYGINLIQRNPDDLFGLKRICRSHGKSIKNIIKSGMATLKGTTE